MHLRIFRLHLYKWSSRLRQLQENGKASRRSTRKHRRMLVIRKKKNTIFWATVHVYQSDDEESNMICNCLDAKRRCNGSNFKTSRFVELHRHLHSINLIMESDVDPTPTTLFSQKMRLERRGGLMRLKGTTR